ncbi:uncharacterized protein LOC133295101 [Gastrolobium bilobum]|uniref:uncharacterized protein LOC133295101 n=1 Tax=Gastrolobium bilobum TaxID=150636 RepID=UPI002AB091E8|nr:uncharacterized protein LOC133295101 [Gastrolobium bilobum]
MSMALLSKNKLSFIDSSLLPPDATDPMFLAWQRCNTMVLAWIHRSINDSIKQSILWIDRAFEAWNDLRDRFRQSDIFRMSDIQEDVYKLQQGELSITDYFTELKKLWDELHNLRPLPSCRCVTPCTCGAITLVRDYRSQDHTVRFLKGLNEQYAHVRSQIMMVDPLPHVSRAFSLVVQQERHFQHDGNSSMDSRVFAGNSSTGKRYAPADKTRFRNNGHAGSTNNRGSKVCTHCGRLNHTVETCYQIHGYPRGYRTSNLKPRSAANYAQFGDSEHRTTNDTQAGLTISQEQYQQLVDLLHGRHLHSSTGEEVTHSTNLVQAVAMNSNSLLPLNNNQPGNTSVHWLLDTGATDHICPILSQFSSTHKISPISIMLPNGTHVVTTLSGSVHLSDSLTLLDVLYVPEFKVNLISVSKLVSVIPCYLTFHKFHCYIKQANTKRTIGIAEASEGLYVLIKEQASHIVQNKSEYSHNGMHTVF